MRCARADRDGPGPLRVRTRPAYRYVSRHVRSALDAAFCNRQHYRHCVYPGLTPRVRNSLTVEYRVCVFELFDYHVHCHSTTYHLL